MDMLDGLNKAMDYIEGQLCGEVDLARAAQLACVSADSFGRFFSYMTGMTLTEYIRRRRLTLAADELRGGECKVIDLAVKYGYDNPDAFTRAFVKQHGITPSAYQKNGGRVKVYPPASFQIKIKGASEMDMRIMEMPQTVVYGISGQYEGMGYKDREQLRNKLWANTEDDVPRRICGVGWEEPGCSALDGVWYGLWKDGRYMIAREAGDVKESGLLEKAEIPAGTYAAFRTEPGGLAWEELPRLREEVFDSWLPTSGYRQKGELCVEVEHLWGDRETRRQKRYYELWVPVDRV